MSTIDTKKTLAELQLNEGQSENYEMAELENDSIRYVLPGWLSAPQRAEIRRRTDAWVKAKVDELRGSKAAATCPSWCKADPHLADEGWVRHERIIQVSPGLTVELTQFSDGGDPSVYVNQRFDEEVGAPEAALLAEALVAVVGLVKEEAAR